MKNKRNSIITIIFVAVLIFGYPIAYYISADDVEIKVTNKERITTGRGENIDSKFIIYTENEVFENTDSWLFFKFNSSDYQNKIKIGKSYNAKVAGWRIPIFSSYRNIINHKEINND